jgi:hypothetical protein
MIGKLKHYFLLLIISFFAACKSDDEKVDPIQVKKVSALTETFDYQFMTEWQKTQVNLIKTTAGFAAPITARAIAYTNLAAYETLVNGMPSYVSLGGQLNGLAKLPVPDSTKEYNWALAASTAQYTVIRDLYISTSDKNTKQIDSLKNALEVKFKVGMSDAVFTQSIQYGAKVANAIIDYAKKDGGATGATNNFPSSYVVPNTVGAWKPTGNQKTPLLPNWGNVRPVLKSNTEDNIVDVPLLFSFEKTSENFKEAKKVHAQSLILTAEQKNIATFFEDGQGTASSPGHFLMLVNKVISEKKYTLDKAIVLLVKYSLAQHDAMVSTWKSKYKYNYMRPKTYITNSIEKNWTPFLAASPSPEYPAEHSVSASAFTHILEKEFSKDLAFVDDTKPGLPNRTFNSLADFNKEVSNSVIYGGTNFGFSSTAGLNTGIKVADNILRLKFKK